MIHIDPLEQKKICPKEVEVKGVLQFPINAAQVLRFHHVKCENVLKCNKS